MTVQGLIASETSSKAQAGLEFSRMKSTKHCHRHYLFDPWNTSPKRANTTKTEGLQTPGLTNREGVTASLHTQTSHWKKWQPKLRIMT